MQGRTYLQNGKVRVLTRNLHDWTKEFPTIVQAMSQLKATDAMIDGEAFVADVGGISHFNLLQRALGRGGDRSRIMFAVFDLPMLNAEDLRDRPLTERRERLHDLLGSPHPEGIVFSEAMEGNPGALWNRPARLVWKVLSRSGWTAPTALAGARNGLRPSASRATSSSSSATSLVAAMADWGVCCWRGLKMGS